MSHNQLRTFLFLGASQCVAAGLILFHVTCFWMGVCGVLAGICGLLLTVMSIVELLT